MPTYKMRVTIEYDAKTEDSGDRYNAVVDAVTETANLMPGRVLVCKDEELGAVLRSKGDDRDEG